MVTRVLRCSRNPCFVAGRPGLVDWKGGPNVNVRFARNERENQGGYNARNPCSVTVLWLGCGCD